MSDYNFDIVIPFFNGHEHIEGLLKTIPHDINVIVIDDHSDNALTYLPYKNVKILKSNRKGYFTGACNIGMQDSNKDVLILNQDTFFTGTRWITQLEECIKDGASIVGEQIKGQRPDGSTYAHGTFFYITREVIDKTGLMNESLYPLWGSTYEYSLRAARDNFKIKPLAEVYNFVHKREEGVNFGSSISTLLKREPKNRSKLVQTPPLVSVVIPTHNFSTWLSDAVNSLVGGMTDLGYFEQQTFASFEVVIVDDSSTDNTPQIIESLVDPWKGVRSIRLDRPRNKVWDKKKDKYIGKVTALNEGIKSSYANYILVVDADDMMETDRIEKMFNYMVNNPNSIVYDNMRTFTDGQRTKEWIVGKEEWETGDGQFKFARCLYKNQVHFSVMFPKTTWKAVGGYCERMIYGREDWNFAIRCASKGFIPHKVDSAGLLYRRDGQNRTLENSKPDWMNFFQKQMANEFPELYRKTLRPNRVDNWF